MVRGIASRNETVDFINEYCRRCIIPEIMQINMRSFTFTRTYLANSNRTLSIFSDSPRHLLTKELLLTLMNGENVAQATAFAKWVFPVPGGPYSKIPIKCKVHVLFYILLLHVVPIWVQLNLLLNSILYKFCRWRESNPGTSHPGYGALTIKLRAAIALLTSWCDVDGKYMTLLILFFVTLYCVSFRLSAWI